MWSMRILYTFVLRAEKRYLISKTVYTKWIYTFWMAQ